MKRFEVRFLQEAMDFMKSLDAKSRNKMASSIARAMEGNAPELFKKLLGTNIWEFRARYNGNSYRLFAFWTKENGLDTIVVATHGISKKTQKTPLKEIEKAEQIRKEYIDGLNIK